MVKKWKTEKNKLYIHIILQAISFLSRLCFKENIDPLQYDNLSLAPKDSCCRFVRNCLSIYKRCRKVCSISKSIYLIGAVIGDCGQRLT